MFSIVLHEACLAAAAGVLNYVDVGRVEVRPEPFLVPDLHCT